MSGPVIEAREAINMYQFQVAHFVVRMIKCVEGYDITIHTTMKCLSIQDRVCKVVPGREFTHSTDI